MRQWDARICGWQAYRCTERRAISRFHQRPYRMLAHSAPLGHSSASTAGTSRSRTGARPDYSLFQLKKQALNRAGARKKSIDFCQEVPATHRFGEAVIAACLKHTLSVFERRIRSHRNNWDPLPTLLPTQMPHQCQSVLILTQRNIQQDQANVGLDLKHLARFCAGSGYHDIVPRSQDSAHVCLSFGVIFHDRDCSP